MSILNKLMPYDLYERHAVISQLLQQMLSDNGNATVLDVGGRKGLLERFLPYATFSVNPDGTGHILGDGGKLPFAAQSYDAVVNIDTLEHLPSEMRLPFIQECLRVSKKLIVVAAPYGSPEHIKLEQRLNELHKQVVGRPHDYLNEHVAYGLPSADQLANIVRALQPATAQFYYAGDFAWQGHSFARAVQAHQQPRLLAHFIHLYNRLSGLALFHRISVTSNPSPTTNRFYLMITK